MCEIDPGTHKGMHSVLLLRTGCDNAIVVVAVVMMVGAAFLITLVHVF
jgi:hypothetical protein